MAQYMPGNCLIVSNMFYAIGRNDFHMLMKRGGRSQRDAVLCPSALRATQENGPLLISGLWVRRMYVFIFFNTEWRILCNAPYTLNEFFYMMKMARTSQHCLLIDCHYCLLREQITHVCSPSERFLFILWSLPTYNISSLIS